MVVLSRASTSPTLALAPYVLLGINITGAIGWLIWIHLRSRQRHSSKGANNRADGSTEERAGLLQRQGGDDEVRGHQGVEGPTGYEMVLEGLQVLTVLALVAISVARMQAGEEKWRSIFDGGVLTTAVSSSCCT